MCRSAGLTLKPLGSSPYKKDKSLDHLYLRNTLITSKNNLIDSRSNLDPTFLDKHINKIYLTVIEFLTLSKIEGLNLFLK